jgi:hypothetical protein
VCRADYFDPLLSRELVARKNEAHLIVQNFCCSTGERAQTVIAQHAQVIAQTHAAELHAINDFHRREGMDVHLRNGVLHCPQDVAIVERRQAMRKTALDADFGRAELPGFDRFLGNLIKR